RTRHPAEGGAREALFRGRGEARPGPSAKADGSVRRPGRGDRQGQRTGDPRAVIRPKFSATATEEALTVPQHVAIIMDGNGRWAAERNLPRAIGHRAGTDNLRAIIKTCVECGVK